MPVRMSLAMMNRMGKRNTEAMKVEKILQICRRRKAFNITGVGPPDKERYASRNTEPQQEDENPVLEMTMQKTPIINRNMDYW